LRIYIYQEVKYAILLYPPAGAAEDLVAMETFLDTKELCPVGAARIDAVKARAKTRKWRMEEAMFGIGRVMNAENVVLSDGLWCRHSRGRAIICIRGG
jgi:hypothetical protein